VRLISEIKYAFTLWLCAVVVSFSLGHSLYKVKHIYDERDVLKRVELRKGITLVHAIDYTVDADGKISQIASSESSNSSSIFNYQNGVNHSIVQGNVEKLQNFVNGTGLHTGTTTKVNNVVKYDAAWTVDVKHRDRTSIKKDFDIGSDLK
jgi:hypothetical protein